MTWEYAYPAASSKDAVRFLIGDTNPDDIQLQDEEIDWLLLQETNVYLAASHACRNLAAKYAREVTKSVGGLSISMGERQSQYRDLAASLATLAEQTTSVPTPIYTAQTVAEKEARGADTTLNHPLFKLGQMDNPGTGSVGG